MIRVNRLTASFCVAVVLGLCCGQGLAQEDSSQQAIGLLRAVEQSRLSYESCDVVLEIDYAPSDSSASKRAVRNVHLVQSGSKRWSQSGGGSHKTVVLIDDGKYAGLNHSKHEDIQLYGARHADGTRGDVAFDPRMLGLTSIYTTAKSLSTCLWLKSHLSAKVAERLPADDGIVWKVELTRATTKTEFIVHEPSFRVLEKVLTSPSRITTVKSEYAGENPFPTVVSIEERANEEVNHRVITVKKFDTNPSISDDQFSLSSLGAEVNTPVLDYEAGRIVGYWDGNAISSEMVKAEQRLQPPSTAELGPPSPLRLWILGLNVAVLLGFAAFVWLKRPAQSQSAKSD